MSVLSIRTRRDLPIHLHPIQVMLFSNQRAAISLFPFPISVTDCERLDPCCIAVSTIITVPVGTNYSSSPLAVISRVWHPRLRSDLTRLGFKLRNTKDI